MCILTKCILNREEVSSKITKSYAGCVAFNLVHLSGIEPPHMASEATALSTELQAHIHKSGQT